MINVTMEQLNMKETYDHSTNSDGARGNILK